MAHEQGLRVSCQTAKFMENQLKQLSGPPKNRLRRIKPAADNPVLLRDPAFADRADCDAACDARNGDQAGHQHDLRWPRCPKRSIRRVGPALGRHLPSTLGYAFNL